ncbi:SOS response-associated peptidase [Nitratireductor basaltis]|uniref:Abasic site processing protein n=1 Tax=Nitratireductor basaltis TaxID=472175 RepID=A0A084UC85_9HYPH|nr:SOS response-associated peptidase [Nitratireductor basaltis]KFB10571.1 hypothetical protein EL18_01608 [Nitratireductor basaltis]
MCGRFSLTASPGEVEALLGVVDIEAFPPRYNIAPTQPVLVALSTGPREPGSNRPDREAKLVRWGFLPSWVKDPKKFPLIINARSETVAEKNSFRAAVRHRRGLLPASGFYEWKREGGKSVQPYWVRPRDGGVIAFAALLETYSEPGGSEIDTGCILTAAANEEFAPIHDRMPVMIPQDQFSRWLDCVNNEPRDVADLMTAPQPGVFEAIPVSNLVNKVANTGLEIQERVEPAELVAPAGRKSKGDDGQMQLF